MKKLRMAALVLTTLSPGRVYAGDPDECMLPKKPRGVSQEALREKVRCANGICGVLTVRG